MTPGGVGPSDKKAIRLFNVRVVQGNAVFTQGLFISGDRAAHTETGIAIHIVAAYKALHQLVDHIIFLRQALTGNIKGYSVRPIFFGKGPEYGGGPVDGRPPAHPL